MSVLRYSTYRNSGVNWLGEVPQHWKQSPFWTLFRRVKRTGFTKETLLSVYREYGVIQKADRDDNFNKPSEDLSAYQLVEVGDLAVNKMKAWQGSLGISRYTGIVSPAYFVYAPAQRECPQFLHYLLRSAEYTAGYLQISEGVRNNQWDLDPQYHSRMPVLIPPLAEQVTITTFLDRETGKIDALVAEQERLIALLKEKRQAVISHAVTKGLNPDAAMKPSGVGWLGQVPGHWNVVRLSTTASVINGFPFESKLFDPQNGTPLVRIRDLNATETEMRFRGDIVEGALITNSDVLIGMDGDFNIGRWRGNGGALLNQRMCCIRGEQAIVRLLEYALQYPLKLINDTTYSTTVKHLSARQIYNIRVALPATHYETVAIITFLDRETRSFDTLTAEASRAITLLRERRAALISAAVTGKIDVRDHRQPAADLAAAA